MRGCYAACGHPVQRERRRYGRILQAVAVQHDWFPGKVRFFVAKNETSFNFLHLHKSIVQCTKVANRNRMPVNGISTLSKGTCYMRFTLPLIALAAFAAPAVATAESGEKVVDVAVAFGDLDITTEEGRVALEQRLDKSLRKACTMVPRPAYALGPVVDEKCISDARAVALAKVERIAAARARRGREVAAN
jgi:UrcA family protein